MKPAWLILIREQTLTSGELFNLAICLGILTQFRLVLSFRLLAWDSNKAFR